MSDGRNLNWIEQQVNRPGQYIPAGVMPGGVVGFWVIGTFWLQNRHARTKETGNE